LQENSPSILSGIAAAGVVGTVVLAVKATPKAEKAISELANDKYFEHGQIHVDDDPSVDKTKVLPVEIVKATWRFYVPAAIVGVATISCIIGANRISLSRNAALMAASTLMDRAFSEYKAKVVEQIGATKEAKVRDAIAEDHVKNNPVGNAQVIFDGSNEALAYDDITGRYFHCDIEKIRKAENEFNSRILGGDMWSSLNDWYTLLGLEHSAVGEILGWNTINLLEIRYSSHLASNGKPVLVIQYAKLPFPDYSKF
jgi:hypothetical protein